ncbi:uncharacterized protein BCR38DRAFT_485498 [Pseudomassariella vexata]|uniref:Biogenesis of lysosome-related organelles complex 1 subunit 1 n=1 Tax=Pseudomassariella vexata TaxID=1141098 RepID=A0A1Y2DYP8_9PEZI|nr:uncharacterized protein BCR38DRAFT_485498 [Pseudomassariella vexata]ORY64339.1 hypothetical protein BCR38DRAFT_485498 [Pseudomassariella vexata]
MSTITDAPNGAPPVAPLIASETPASRSGTASSSRSPNMTPGPSNTASPPLSSASFPAFPSLPSTTSVSRPPPSHSASHSISSPRTAAMSMSTSASPPTTATTPVSAPALNPNLPSQSTQMHIAEARAALVASMSNLLDSELQGRAALLHSNAAALAKQEKDVAKATEGLRKENDKLAKVARDAGRKIKETGNVQNWAEVLERDFLVLEETLRLVREGSDEGSEASWSGSYSGSGSGSGSGSECEGGSGRRSRTRSRRRSVVSGVEDFLARGKQDIDGGAGNEEPGMDKGKGIDEVVEDAAMDDVVGSEELDQGRGVIGYMAPPIKAGDRDVSMDADAAGEREGAFASVNDAIVASIREAMETSVDDRSAPEPGTELHLEGKGKGKGKEFATKAEAMDVDVPEASDRALGIGQPKLLKGEEALENHGVFEFTAASALPVT